MFSVCCKLTLLCCLTIAMTTTPVTSTLFMTSVTMLTTRFSAASELLLAPSVRDRLVDVAMPYVGVVDACCAGEDMVNFPAAVRPCVYADCINLVHYSSSA